MKVVFLFHILKTMLTCKNQLQSTVGTGVESRFLCSKFCRAINLIAPHCAVTFDDGIKHRTTGDMESTLLGSAHGKSTKQKRMDVLPIKKLTRRGTVSFLHHLVSFSCNYNQDCDTEHGQVTALRAREHRGHLLDRRYIKTI